MKSAYYNENDAYACQWLRNLIAAGLIAPGDVDERSIVDVRADDLAGYEQCHFFAGIGGWPYVLRLAGWPDDRVAWTGSCPCQPISSAGKQKGHADERHLWPAFYELIAECRPATVVGEQVAGALGREWLAGVRADLEDAGYAVGAANLCAASCGAPHIRQRLFWVAQSAEPRRSAQPQRASKPDGWEAQEPRRLCGTGGLGLSNGPGSQQRQQTAASPRHGNPSIATGDVLRMGDPLGPRLEERPGFRPNDEPERPAAERAGGDAGRMGDATISGRREEHPLPGRRTSRNSTQGAAERSGAGFWSRAEWLACLDGKARRVEPGIFPLAAGLPAAMDGGGPISRVGTLSGAGNAIVAQVAAEFVRAFLECAP